MAQEGFTGVMFKSGLTGFTKVGQMVRQGKIWPEKGNCLTAISLLPLLTWDSAPFWFWLCLEEHWTWGWMAPVLARPWAAWWLCFLLPSFPVVLGG